LKFCQLWLVGMLILPILFNENPTAFIGNSVCTIFVGLLNTTCNSFEGNVTFIGESPITITPNYTDNTVTWAFVFEGNATNQTQVHVSLGGADVFKNETGGVPNIIFFRGLSEGAGINITERENTILIESDIAQTLCNINIFIGFLLQGLFDCAVEGDTVDFVGLNGIGLSNSSSITWFLNATLNNLNDVNVTNVDENEILLYNITTGNFTNVPINDVTALVDVYFNAEEATIDDLTEVDCVNDVTYSLFDNTNPNEYRRQAIEMCSSGDIDDNFTWLYTVPKGYSTPTDYKFRVFWTDDDSSASSYMQVAANDCEESTSTGVGTCSSSDWELHDDGTVGGGYGAVRYTGIPIPNGATIINAEIQYHVDVVHANVPLTVTFTGEDIDDSPTLNGANNNIGNRVSTTASVNWAVPHWAAVSDEGPAQLTPDLSTIIQEIVDRPGWVSGNDIAIMIKSWPDNSGHREAELSNGEAANAPTISISWSTGGGSPVCLEYSVMPLQNTEVMDGTFSARDTVCVNRSGNDQLSVTEFIVNATDHQFSPEDLVFHRIVRPDNFVAGDFESDIFVFGGELQWLN